MIQDNKSCKWQTFSRESLRYDKRGGGSAKALLMETVQAYARGCQLCPWKLGMAGGKLFRM
jgi:hypothetical protein